MHIVLVGGLKGGLHMSNEIISEFGEKYDFLFVMEQIVDIV
jgi:hypothetical protein